MATLLEQAEVGSELTSADLGRNPCAHRFDLCVEQPPLLDRVGGNHPDACHLEPKQKKELRETTIHPELIGNAE